MTGKKVLRAELRTIGVDDGARECPTCEDRKPLTGDYWNKDPHGPDGIWHHECRQCKNDRRHKKRIEAEVRELQLIRREMVMQMQKSDKSGPTLPPSRTELAQQLIQHWGSETTIMEELIADYRTSKPGSPQRQKYMALIVSILDKAADSVPTRNAEDMSTEELEAMISSLITFQGARNAGGAGTPAEPKSSLG